MAARRSNIMEGVYRHRVLVTENHLSLMYGVYWMQLSADRLCLMAVVY